MSKRSSHAGKNRATRDRYARYIQTLDYEPTVEEALAFASSNEGGEELREPTTKRRRKINTKERLVDHLAESWPSYLIGLFALILVYLMYDSKVELARTGVKLDYQKEEIANLSVESKNHLAKNHQQDLSISENRIKIDALERNTSSPDRLARERSDSLDVTRSEP